MKIRIEYKDGSVGVYYANQAVFSFAGSDISVGVVVDSDGTHQISMDAVKTLEVINA